MFCCVISFDEKLSNEQLGIEKRQHKGEHKFRQVSWARQDCERNTTAARDTFVNSEVFLSAVIVTLFKDASLTSSFREPC
jgi:hypothetical protein